MRNSTFFTIGLVAFVGIVIIPRPGDTQLISTIPQLVQTLVGLLLNPVQLLNQFFLVKSQFDLFTCPLLSTNVIPVPNQCGSVYVCLLGILQAKLTCAAGYHFDPNKLPGGVCAVDTPANNCDKCKAYNSSLTTCTTAPYNCSYCLQSSTSSPRCGSAVNLLGNGCPVSQIYNQTSDGWFVIQRRGAVLGPGDTRQDFYLYWADYVAGFGDVTRDFWLGLDHMVELIQAGIFELQIQLNNFGPNDIGLASPNFANYASFLLSSANDGYRLNATGFSGNTTDSFAYHNGHVFETRDNNTDGCPITFFSAWWYHSCWICDLNGVYYNTSAPGPPNGCGGIHWKANGFCGDPNLAFTEMRLRKTGT